MTTIMALDGVGKTYRARDGRQVVALTPTNLEVRTGEFVSVVGPSGCGKTTMLNMMAGLIAPTTGTIRFAGATPPGTGRSNDPSARPRWASCSSGRCCCPGAASSTTCSCPSR